MATTNLAYRLSRQEHLDELLEQLKRILEVDTVQRQLHETNGTLYMGWEWRDVGIDWRQLDRYITLGALKAGYRSRAYKNYMVADPAELAQTIAALEEGGDVQTEIPDDLFDVIVGYDDVKRIFKMSLAASAPVHVLLEGPPGTAKSLFQEELCRIPESRYTLGGMTSKAGLFDYLLRDRPKFLVIDEIEYLQPRDQVALLSLMATGTIARLKHGAQDLQKMEVWVFAGCNRTRTLSPALLDRFKTVRLKPYTPAEFSVVVRNVLTSHEGIDPELAGYIAFKLRDKTLSVREAVRFGRACKSTQDVDYWLRVSPPRREDER